MKTLASAAYLIIILAINHTFTSALQSTPLDSVAQKPAVFTDPDRVEKIKATAATVDEIFGEYSEKHHMPGFVYGIVLDGKLIYSGDFGYSNLEQKIAVESQFCCNIHVSFNLENLLIQGKHVISFMMAQVPVINRLDIFEKVHRIIFFY